MIDNLVRIPISSMILKRSRTPPSKVIWPKPRWGDFTDTADFEPWDEGRGVRTSGPGRPRALARMSPFVRGHGNKRKRGWSIRVDEARRFEGSVEEVERRLLRASRAVVSLHPLAKSVPFCFCEGNSIFWNDSAVHSRVTCPDLEAVNLAYRRRSKTCSSVKVLAEAVVYGEGGPVLRERPTAGGATKRDGRTFQILDRRAPALPRRRSHSHGGERAHLDPSARGW